MGGSGLDLYLSRSLVHGCAGWTRQTDIGIEGTMQKSRAKRQMKAIFTAFGLLALGLLGQSGWAAESGDLKTMVVPGGENGRATVIFQPINLGDSVRLYSNKGVAIGTWDGENKFEMDVSAKALAAATATGKVDVQKLLFDMRSVKRGKRLFFEVKLPKDAPSIDGTTTLAAGSTAYVSVDSLIDDPKAKKPVTAVPAPKEAKITPVAAVPVAKQEAIKARDEAVRQFNEKLETGGVVDAPATTAPRGHNHDAHGLVRVPLTGDRSNAPAPPPVATGAKVFPSPLCSDTNSSMRVTSYFGPRRSVKTSSGEYATRYHKGMDIAAPKGTPVRAVAAGCVQRGSVTFNRHAGYGLSMIIEHEGGLASQYGHLDKFDAKIQTALRAGQKVCFARGDVIGNSGMSGSCTGPHLHFGVYHNGKAVDPRPYLIAQSDADFSTSCRDLTAQIQELDKAAPAAAAPLPMTPGASAASGEVAR